MATRKSKTTVSSCDTCFAIVPTISLSAGLCRDCWNKYRELVTVAKVRKPLTHTPAPVYTCETPEAYAMRRHTEQGHGSPTRSLKHDVFCPVCTNITIDAFVANLGDAYMSKEPAMMSLKTTTTARSSAPTKTSRKVPARKAETVGDVLDAVLRDLGIAKLNAESSKGTHELISTMVGNGDVFLRVAKREWTCKACQSGIKPMATFYGLRVAVPALHAKSGEYCFNCMTDQLIGRR